MMHGFYIVPKQQNIKDKNNASESEKYFVSKILQLCCKKTT